MDYNDTLNLPKTDFPMRGNLPQQEPGILKKWKDNDIYNALLRRDADKPRFVLHDGPPYANGEIHVGHALNRTLKDIVIKYKSMRGYNTPFVPGWDTHGLPTELRAIKERKVRKDTVGMVPYREICRDIAEKYHQIQSASFEALGCRADYDRPYLTFLGKYEAEQVKVFGEMALRGYVYKGLKPVYWCVDCQTALAEAEVEYSDDPSNSYYVKFPIKDDGRKIKAAKGSRISFVIWTTTAWTLPGNLAISLNPDAEYALIKNGGEYYIIAKALVKTVAEQCKLTDIKTVATYKGAELEGIKCRHPFLERDSLVINGNHVTLDTGTGCVHTAPGFGMDDYSVCQKYKEIPIVVPVNGRGIQTEEAGIFAGQYYEKSSAAIAAWLKDNNYLLGESKIVHSYPHCWRCRKPIIMRATEQWFVSVDAFRQAAVDEANKVKWKPEWGRERITKMINDRGDWCISRQRAWGVPIPVLYCADCGKPVINRDVFARIADIFRQKTSNAWFELSPDELLGEFKAEVACSCGGKEFGKETDIMDVWFDSGVSHAAVFNNWAELGEPPADLYLEGSDQYRGWFQSSLLTSVATGKGAPYQNVVSHGYTVDGQGRKMSKSLGNGIDPKDICKKYGTDILRMWVAAADYTNDIKVSTDIFDKLAEQYKKFRNTIRFALGNIYDFNPQADSVPYTEMPEIDRFALHTLAEFVRNARKAYDAYSFHQVIRDADVFVRIGLSANYFDVIKDRLYTAAATGHKRRSAQTVLYIIADTLTKIMTPVLSFTAEEIWTHLPKSETEKDYPSIQFCAWPQLSDEYFDSELADKWNKILAVKADVLRTCEIVKKSIGCGSPLEMNADIYAKPSCFDFVNSVADEIRLVSVISGITVLPITDCVDANAVVSEDFDGLKIIAYKARGNKCGRCWSYSESVEGEGVCAKCAAELDGGTK